MRRTDDDRDVAESAEPEDEEYEAPSSPGPLPFEAEPADVLEQAQAVPADEDDYR